MGKKIEITKGIVGFAASIGSGIIVGNAVGLVTMGTTRLLPTIAVRVAAVGLGIGVGNFAEQTLNKSIDQVVDVFSAAKPEIDKLKATITEATPTNNEGQ